MNTSTLHTIRLSARSVLLAAIASVFVIHAGAQSSLKPGKTIQKNINGGVTHEYQLPVKAGRFARFEVEHKNVEVVVTVLDESGKSVAELSGKFNYFWRESLSVIARQKNEKFRVKVKAFGDAKLSGTYSIRIVEMREAAANDEKRIKAEQHLCEASRFRWQEKPDQPTVIKELKAALPIWREVGDLFWEAITLSNLGWSYQDDRQYQPGIEAHNQALEIYRSLNDRMGLSKAYNGLGRLYTAIDNYDKAIEAFSQSLPIRLELGDKLGALAVLLNIGDAYYYGPEPAKSIPYYEQAAALSRESKDSEGELMSVSNLAFSYKKLKDFQKTVDYASEWARLARDLGNVSEERKALVNQALAYINLDQNDKALEIYTKALPIAEKENDPAAIAAILNDFGVVYEALKDYDRALDFYKRAIALRRKEEDKNGLALALKNSGGVYAKAGKLEAAIEAYSEERSVRQGLKQEEAFIEAGHIIAGLKLKLNQQKESIEEYEKISAYLMAKGLRTNDAGDKFFNIGWAYNETGNFDKALEYYDISLKIRRETNHLPGEAISLIAIGGVYNFGLKNHQKAREYFEQGLAKAREAATIKVTESLAIFGLGNVAENLRDYPTALSHYNSGLSVANEANDPSTQNLNRSGLATVYQKLLDFDKAIFYQKQNLEASEKVGDPVSIGSTLNSIGSLYLSMSDFEAARDHYLRSRDVLRPTRSRVNEGLALAGIGAAYVNLNEFDLATVAYKEQLDLSKEVANKPNIYVALLGLASVNLKLYRYDEAEGYYRSAIKVAQEMKDKLGEGNTLVELGNMYGDISQFEKSRDLQEQALAIFREIGDKNGESHALNNIGRAFYSLGLYREADQYFEKALNLKKEIGEKQGLDVMLSNMGAVKSNLNDYEPAKGYYDQATEVAKEVRNQVMESLIEGYVGGVYFNDGNQYEKALPLYQRSLEMSVKARNKRGEAGALDSLGTVSRELGRYDDAKDYYDRSLAIFRTMKNRQAEAAVLSHLGELYIQIGNYALAREHYEKAIAIQEDIKDRRGVGSSSMSLGAIARQAGDNENARVLQMRALEIFRDIGVKRDEAHALYHLARVESAVNRNEKAREYLNGSLAIFREIKDRRQEGRVLNSLGQIFRKLGQHSESKTRHQAALGIFRDIKARQEEGDTLRDLMETAVSEGSGFMAVAYGKKAIEAYQEVRGNIKKLDAESQQGFVREKESTYRMLADQLISQGRIPEAQIVLGLLKREEFSKPVTRDGADAVMPYTDADARLLALIEKLVPLEHELVRLQQIDPGKRTPDENRMIKEKNAEIVEINSALDTALKELAATAITDPDMIGIIREGLKNRRENSADSLKTVLNSLNDRERGAKVVALYTLLGEKKRGERSVKFGWVVMVTETGQKAYPVDASNLDSMVSQFRGALGDTAHDPAPVAQAIYTALFRQRRTPESRTLEEDLNLYMKGSREKTLMWSLDGVLRYIPMAALHDGEGYLIGKYRNVVLTNKNFGALKDKKNEKWRVLGLGVSEKRENFDALPGVKRELENIVRLPNSQSGIFDGSINLDADFRKESFFTDIGSRAYPVVHIASHYVYNAGNVNESYLLVGDGRVTFQDMVNADKASPTPLFAGVDLFALSACDSGLTGNGKENEGFAVTAQDLGARSVLASLWPVPDEGTAELMVRFYRPMATDKNISKGEAFRQAQLSFAGIEDRIKLGAMDTPRGTRKVPTGGKIDLPPYVRDEKRPYAHPHYWASFVLIGNWR